MLIELGAQRGDLQVWLSIKPGSLSVCLNEVEVYSFDWEGRLLTAWVNGQTYVRTLDNRVIKKWRDSDPSTPWKLIKELEADEKQPFLNQVWAQMNSLHQQLQRGQLNPIRREEMDGHGLEAARQWLGKIVAWDYERLETERERFFSVYTPVSILPPDQYFTLVLQATEGCHWNRCTFCHFYRHRRFRIKSEEEFSRHINAVKGFFGEAIRLRRSVFLGDANALVIPQEQLLRIFDRVNQAFPIAPPQSAATEADGHRLFQGIYSFIDAFSGDKKSEADFRELRVRNLRRVYVGVETGCDELLEFLNKPATARQALETVTAMKRAGLSVGVIILIGVGGAHYSQSHVEQTINLLNAMNLGRGDILYFSPLVDVPTSEYAQRAAETGIRSLTEQERQEQLKAIRSGLRFSSDSPPKVSLYDIREFVY